MHLAFSAWHTTINSFDLKLSGNFSQNWASLIMKVYDIADIVDRANIPDGRRYADDNLLDPVRELLKESVPEINPEQIILNATHTHNAPTVRARNIADIQEL